MRGKRLFRVTVLLALMALVAAACGTDAEDATEPAEETPEAAEAPEPDDPEPAPDEEGEEPAEEEPDEVFEVTLGSIPIVLLAPLVHAQNEGWFEEEGISVTLDTGAASGAANLTQVIAGDFEIGLSDVPSVMLALDRGLEVEGIAPVNAGGATPEDTYSAVGVAPDSGIESAEDLEGATIAVNALNNISDITIKGALESRGVDSSTVTFVEMPLADAPAAVLEGRVDAALLLEPFMGVAAGQGAEMVLFNYTDTIPTGAVAVYFTTPEFVEEHPEVVTAFQTVMDRSTEFMADNDDLVRELVPTYTQIPEEGAAQMRLPVFDPDQLGPEAIESLNELMVDLELLDEPVPPEAVCPTCWG